MPKRTSRTRSTTDFIATAATAGEEAAANMSLEGEARRPSAATLAEWADDWYQQHGVPSLEKAADDAGKAVHVDDAELKAAFEEAFVAAMHNRLTAKPARRAARGALGLEGAAAEAGQGSASQAEDDDFDGGLASATRAEIARVATDYFEANGDGALAHAAGRARVAVPAEGSSQYAALQAVYVEAFIAQIERRRSR